MGQTTEDLQEQLNSALRRAETAEYWIERNADLLRERAESAEALTPERDHGPVSISEMNRRIAEAVAEVARLTADNDRLIATVRADEWQARYWAEHDAVADREATIMAERAQSAAMRKALEATVAAWSAEYVDFFGDAPPGAENVPAIVNARAVLQSPDPGKSLLDAHAAELKEIGEQLEADRTATADGVTAIKRAVASRRWLAEDGRGSYEWDDDRYRGEFRQAVTEIETALEPLAKIAADWQNCPRTGPAIVEARQDLKSANAALRQRAEAAEAALRRITSRRTENMTEATYAYCCELAERALGGEGK